MDYKSILSRISNRIQMIMLDRDAMRLIVAVLVVVGFIVLASSFGKISM